MGRRNDARLQKRTADTEQKPKDYLKNRDKDVIEHYVTPIMNHPDPSQIGSLEQVSHTWKTGDRFFKLAHEHYGDSSLWWVIAWYNQKPTEAHLDKGDVIQIPFPLEKVLKFLEV